MIQVDLTTLTIQVGLMIMIWRVVRMWSQAVALEIPGLHMHSKLSTLSCLQSQYVENLKLRNSILV